MTSVNYSRRNVYVTKRVFFYLFLALISVMCILPYYWMVRASFMKNTQIFVLDPFIFWPKTMQWDNYVMALTTMPFVRYLCNTLFILVGTMFGVLLTSSMGAYAFSRIKWRGRELCFALTLSTLMMPGTVTLISQYILWNDFGTIDTYIPLILPAFLGGGAFNIFLIRQFFLTIPTELDEAATVDGAGSIRIFFSIVMPLAKPALIVVGLFCFLGTWNDFFGPLIYLNTQDKFTLALGLLQFKGDYSTKWNLIMAASTVIIAPCIAIFLIGQKYLIGGISLTGMKA